MDELELRKSALVPNGKNATCCLCEQKLYPNTIKHHCGTKHEECRVDQIKCVHCAEVVVMVDHKIMNKFLNTEAAVPSFCKCYNSDQYESTWVSDEIFSKFISSTTDLDKGDDKQLEK